jgi:hypothetical protein
MKALATGRSIARRSAANRGVSASIRADCLENPAQQPLRDGLVQASGPSRAVTVLKRRTQIGRLTKVRG